MNETNELRNKLRDYIRYKFSNIPDIYNMSDDIVNEAWLKAAKDEHKNFGYLQAVCVRLAYKIYRERKNQTLDTIDIMISEDDVVGQILENERASLILDSLEVLREIERRIIILRYYEDCSFAEISGKIGVNINTVLTIHRRTLEKLRPRLSKILDFDKGFESDN